MELYGDTSLDILTCYFYLIASIGYGSNLIKNSDGIFQIGEF